MTGDAFGLATSSTDAQARDCFETAQRAFAAHRPQAAGAIAASLEADATHVGALTLKGFAQVLLARAELLGEARASHSAARTALAACDGGTADERMLVEALGHAAHGHLARAASTLEEGFAGRPAALLPFKLCHQLRFMLGDRDGMLRASTGMLRNWDETLPGAGFLLGCHAFALEEHGRYAEAEAAGRLAVSIDADDSWGLHAVSHVYEMRGETEQGIAWLEQSRPTWSECNNFAFHVAWHLALYYLERGQHARVLELYDREVRPSQTDDFRDVANAVSLLWRLETMGVNVSHRWEDLTDVLMRRQADTTLVFATLNALAGLLAIGARSAAGQMIAALEQRAGGSDEQALVARHVGLPVARFLLRRPAGGRGAILSLVHRLPELGGSNAQRDFFLLWIARTMAEQGDREGAHALLHHRRALRADDRLGHCVTAHMPATLSTASIASH